MALSTKSGIICTSSNNNAAWNICYSSFFMFKKTYILLILLVSISTWLLGSGVSAGITPKQAYHSAEACYKKLRNSSAKMKYRDNWVRCIKKFKQVYRLDPGGSWAPAGLYRSGKLYQELANYSGKKIRFGTGLKGEELPCHCPYCGHKAPQEDFATPGQIEYAK